MTDPVNFQTQKLEMSRLRERALQRLKQHRPELFEMDVQDIANMLHELDVRQTELEVQNEELRRSQAELAQAHEQYLKLFELAPVGYLTLDSQGIIRRVNLAMMRLCGLDRGAIIGSRIEQLVSPEEREFCFVSVRQAALSGKIQRLELKFLKAGESFFYAMMETMPTGGHLGGDKDAFQITITDISRRKQAEEELRRSINRMAWVLDQTGVGMWLNPLPLSRLHWDTQTRRLFFVPPGTEPTVELFYSRLHPDDREPTRLAIEKALRNRTLYAMEHRAVNPETGESRWIRSIGQASYADDGTPSRFDGINFDITWRRQAEEELKRLNETLEQRIAERTAEFNAQSEKLRSLASQLSLTEQRERKRLAQILHDHIQQLIVAARMQSEWIRHTKEPSKILEAAQTATAILDEALEASRSLAIDLSPPVLHEIGLIGSLRWLAERMKEQHRFSVKVHADSAAEPSAEDKRFLLFDCARELLFNAVKHSGAKEAQVGLLRMKYGHIKLVISDDGKGFDAARIDERNPKEITFGLFNIQQRLWQIGGRMEITTAPGKGTKIAAIVPDITEQSSVAEEAEIPEDRTGIDTSRITDRSDRCRVLIVDDHEVVREGLSRLLKMAADVELVGKAADGPQAIEFVDTLAPDIVLMDVNLGEMNGAEATRRILAKHPNIKVIGLSVRDDAGVIALMREAGAVAYLTKSAHSKDILATIRNCYNS